jgi:ATP-dependent Clp protease ATP-binding subunit ClpX
MEITTPTSGPKILPTPAEMIAYLNRFVQGQEQAKQLLSRAVYFHYLNLANPTASTILAEREHCLLIGPTGSGKTLLVKKLAEMLAVPMLYVNAAGLTSEGYVGENISDVLIRFFKLCGTKERMARGILFIDEIDKIRLNQSHQEDIRGAMVQQQLLAPLDGNIVTHTQKYSLNEYTVDTSKILFIAAGAFAGIEKFIGTRGGNLGFHRNGDAREESSYDTQSILPEDIISFGFMPEFVARFPNIAALKKLSREDLVAILGSTVLSPITYYSNIFQLHEIELTFTQSALVAVADRAISQKQGARGLRQIISSVIGPTACRIAELAEQGVKKVVIEEGVVYGQEEAEIHLGERRVAGCIDDLRRTVFLWNNEDERSRNQGISTLSGNSNGSAVVDEGETITVSFTTGWSDQQLLARYGYVRTKIRYEQAEKNARSWWDLFEAENWGKKQILVRLIEDLASRNATIDDLFQAYLYSSTDDIESNLHFLDYTRARTRFISDKSWRLESKFCGRSGATPENARSLTFFEQGSKPAQFLWRCLEAEASYNGEMLTGAAIALSSAGVSSVDDFLDASIWCGVYDPEAVIANINFFNSFFAKTGRVPSGVLPLRRSIMDLNLKEPLSPSDQKNNFLRSIAAALFWERVRHRSSSISLAAIDFDIGQFEAAFVGSRIKSRALQGIRSSGSWRAELQGWCDAISSYPGAVHEEMAIPWIEGIIAELSPILQRDTSWMTLEDINEIVQKLISAIYHFGGTKVVAAPLVLYTGERLDSEWKHLIAQLPVSTSIESELAEILRTTWQNFQEGIRTLPLFELEEKSLEWKTGEELQ